MRQFVPKLFAVVVAATVLSIAIGLVTALGQPSATSSRKAFSGNLCTIHIAGALASLNISGGCIKVRTVKRTTRTPLGSVTTETFDSHWGAIPKSGPSHFVAVFAARESGSAAAIAAGRNKLRAHILAHGQLVSIGSVASLYTETVSCLNPPTDDCTKASLLAIVKNYIVEVVLLNAPPTGSGSAEQSLDSNEDNAQEDLVKSPVISIAGAVAQKL